MQHTKRFDRITSARSESRHGAHFIKASRNHHESIASSTGASLKNSGAA